LIGGGIIGASIAYHLRQDGFSGRLLVIECDTTYARAATPLSLGGIRQLYGVACNIQMACYSLEFYERFDEVMSGAWGRAQAHFHQRGYLLLLDDQNRDAWLRRYEVQRRMGVEVEMLPPQQVHELFPHLHVGDVAYALFSQRDGYLNPRGALQGFVERSRELHCTWLQDEVVGFTPFRGRHSRSEREPAGIFQRPPWSSSLAPGRSRSRGWPGSICRCGRYSGRHAM
jgi:FAD-dependent oxidoreductase domain-containing protein 1